VEAKKISIKLPGGVLREYPTGIHLSEIADDLGGDLKERAIIALLNGRAVDLSTELAEDANVRFLTAGDEEGMTAYRHSASHIMAQAVKDLFPRARLGIGPAISDGFYYDFDVEKPFSADDLEKIEARMREIVKENLPFERRDVKRDEAMDIFKKADEPYKLELLAELGEEVSLYKHDDFVDLCRGPHVPSTGRVRSFKLLSSAGAYWKGDENNKMLQRIYGAAYEREEDLEKHLALLEEAKKRDHRKLGNELDLFSVHEEAGAGLVYWHPKGAALLEIIMDFWKQEHIKRGYQLVSTPHMARGRLWRSSGHLDFYADNMYVFDVDGEEHVIKPMNCPMHMIIYKTRVRSYRDLPLRYAELGTVYRKEKSGVLHGTLRVRGFTQDDGHIFCMPDQLVDELVGVIDLARFMMSAFGFSEYRVDLSLRDPREKEKYMGSDEDWERAESALVQSLERAGLPFERAPGEAVFYGPKIDIKLLDALGRPWQATTIQFDFNLPERFKITYAGKDGRQHTPYVIHRAILGALERFVGTLLEHHAGALPVWMSPVQVRVMTITEEQYEYAESVAEALRSEGLRVEMDSRNEKIGHKIREAETEKIPYMIILGQREVEQKKISLRKRREGDVGQMGIDEFLELARSEIAGRV
jgi:threonyl-tRNA synthetase